MTTDDTMMEDGWVPCSKYEQRYTPDGNVEVRLVLDAEVMGGTRAVKGGGVIEFAGEQASQAYVLFALSNASVILRSFNANMRDHDTANSVRVLESLLLRVVQKAINEAGRQS